MAFISAIVSSALEHLRLELAHLPAAAQRRRLADGQVQVARFFLHDRLEEAVNLDRRHVDASHVVILPVSSRLERQSTGKMPVVRINP